MPIIVPYNVVQNLTGNVSFEQVEIAAGVLPINHTLSLDMIGTNTTNLLYVFPSGFQVAMGGTVAVGTYVPVAIGSGQTFTDDGALSFSIGDTVTFQGGESQIAVGGGGALAASGTTFTGPTNANITVDSAGSLSIASSTYTALALNLEGGSTDSVFDVVFSGTLTVDSAAGCGHSGRTKHHRERLLPRGQ